MFSTRILGVLLLVAAVVSFGFAIYWFNQSVEPRAKLKEMKASAQTFADITQTEKNSIGTTCFACHPRQVTLLGCLDPPRVQAISKSSNSVILLASFSLAASFRVRSSF